MNPDTITTVSDMITDAVEEIEYLIEISNEQRHQDQEEMETDVSLAGYELLTNSSQIS